MSKESLSFYQIIAKDATSVDVLMYGYIGPYEDIDDKVFIRDWKMLEGKYKQVTVHLNCGGGSVFSGLAIYNTIKNSPLDTLMINEGLAGSMGSILFLAVPVEKRHMASNARIMIHKPSGGAFGSAQKLRETADNIDSLEETMADIYAEATGQDPDEVEAWMKEGVDKYFTAKEAQAVGLVGKIIGTSPVKAPSAQLRDEAALYEHFRMALQSSSRDNWDLKAWIDNDIEGLARLIDEDHARYQQLYQACQAKGLTPLPISNPTNLSTNQPLLMSTNNKATWNFDKWRKEAPRELEKMQVEDPTRYEQLRKDRSKGEAIMKASWDFDKWRKEDPQGLEKMQREEPQKYAQLRDAYVAQLKARG